MSASKRFHRTAKSKAKTASERGRSILLALQVVSYASLIAHSFYLRWVLSG
jgi:hypothetical protein